MVNPAKQYLVAVPALSEREVILKAFKSLGCRDLTWAVTGQEATDFIKNRHDAFVLAAWELPGLEGPRLVTTIRKQPHSKHWPCILIVPEVHDTQSILSKKLGASGYLVRPLSLEKVVGIIQETSDNQSDAVWPYGMETEADQLFENQQYDQARQVYERSLEAGRQRLAGLHTEIGQVLQQKGQYEEAVGHLEKAVELAPELPRTRLSLGEAYLNSGRIEEAGEAFFQALKRDPGNERTKRLLIDNLIKSGQNRVAEKIIGSLMKQNPSDNYLLNRMGMALRKQGKLKEALINYQKAIQIDDQDEHLYFNLGRCYFELGALEEALFITGKALKLNPELNEARELLAKIKQQ